MEQARLLERRPLIEAGDDQYEAATADCSRGHHRREQGRAERPLRAERRREREACPGQEAR